MLLDIILKIFLPLGGAYLGVVLGFNKYKNEKNWDKKVKVYEDVITLIEKISFSANAYSYSITSETPAGYSGYDYNVDLHEPIRKLSHLEITSEIFLSEKFSCELSQFISEIQDLYMQLQRDDFSSSPKDRDYMDVQFIQKIGNIADNALENLKKEARKEIVSESFFQKIYSYINSKKES
ncbi:hypothetical protein AB7188_01170 [Providencia rettgeri]|uniref:hypothetical protein n=1 Tax=Providencia rettgeri TaxID=587 RepID=UPI0032DB4DC6